MAAIVDRYSHTLRMNAAAVRALFPAAVTMAQLPSPIVLTFAVRPDRVRCNITTACCTSTANEDKASCPSTHSCCVYGVHYTLVVYNAAVISCQYSALRLQAPRCAYTAEARWTVRCRRFVMLRGDWKPISRALAADYPQNPHVLPPGRSAHRRHRVICFCTAPCDDST